ncbi:MAG: OmpA family protein [Bryobacteraceae bacterium]|nr:OmpA family protein [Bryobacteraceae bacterium]
MSSEFVGVRGRRGFATGAVLAIVLAFGATGCASKKFVRNRVDPVQTRVDNIDSQVQEHSKNIDELERTASKMDERIGTVDQRAQSAAQAASAKADEAGQRAQQANEAASNAKSLADEALTGVDTLSKRVDNVNQYQVAFEESVLFNFESSQLTDESKKKLDEAAAKITPDSPYLIEVTGFTDQTGGRTYNVTLSEQRARNVVRYLTSQHNIPLHRIHVMGFGSENPVAKNNTREGRKMNRRVEVRLYTSNAYQGGQQTSQMVNH